MNRNAANPDSGLPKSVAVTGNDCEPLRMAIVTRRFWPLAGATEYAIGDLATELRSAGHEVQIVTIRWEKNWPSDCQYREIPIHRIYRPASAPWGNHRYLRNLNQYLAEQELDSVIVFGLGEEACSIAQSLGPRQSLMLRIDNHFFGTAEKGRLGRLTQRQLSTLKRANGVIVESDWTRQRLLDQVSLDETLAKQLPTRLATISHFVNPDLDNQRSRVKQMAARVALANAHPMLQVDANAPLVICGCPLNGDGGPADLVNAWSDVYAKIPTARLWVLGEGAKSRRLWDHILRRQLISSVIMPGCFDDMSVPFEAADLFVHPMRAAERCGFLDYAMAAGLCAVVTQSDSDRIIHDETGLVVPANSASELGACMLRALRDSDLRRRLGRAAMKSTKAAYDSQDPIRQIIDAVKQSAACSTEPDSPQLH